jgi:hypothetical protein
LPRPRRGRRQNVSSRSSKRSRRAPNPSLTGLAGAGLTRTVLGAMVISSSREA